jgi:hypothetical protein
MDRSDRTIAVLAYLVAPGLVAATSWHDGVAAVIGMFLLMLLLDAILVAFLRACGIDKR